MNFTLNFELEEGGIVLYVESQGQYPRPAFARRLSIPLTSKKLLKTDLREQVETAVALVLSEYEGDDMPELGEVLDQLYKGDFMKFVIGGCKIFGTKINDDGKSITQPQPIPRSAIFKRDDVTVLSITFHAETYPAKVDEDTGEQKYGPGVTLRLDKLLIVDDDAPTFGFAIKGGATPALVQKKKKGAVAKKAKAAAKPKDDGAAAAAAKPTTRAGKSSSREPPKGKGKGKGKPQAKTPIKVPESSDDDDDMSDE